ncbi:hypothetical protein CAOG_05728 [Capsaspora owczarzaki ATCC 30864]|uniref:Small ribosomal subunit protein mS33 n=1 Tax=Capsaspora owczarzaki (strain ATCC 30864) TaxID=595528 RepID=E9CC88_CAPO3|nr:hypothetical protein CAOG_08350 [Capsaspora owczarzaki ATCC 30864]XP_004346401.1 hypothetical protein CAOG_05728 [Capsaspora owczarzaki ATCC 30864]KJE95255.1 hypothetical protein CAOG_005728 [Capsaspora owczarzaki ATCC 30864]KJE98403.1 hypothetical protein CAOG_008350 [Capsaspora owczarzaki ATCC 30864]|eukprot:XP_004340769.1 hypothetical protein CAOG_08350 [Capsaspora owczarzaki ATCC 30864]
MAFRPLGSALRLSNALRDTIAKTAADTFGHVKTPRIVRETALLENPTDNLKLAPLVNQKTFRTATSFLRRPLIGERVASRYPPYLAINSVLKHLHAVGQLANEEESDRLFNLDRLRKRGKGAPKKGQSKRANKKK